MRIDQPICRVMNLRPGDGYANDVDEEDKEEEEHSNKDSQTDEGTKTFLTGGII